jgi:hypothetical protein
MVSQRPRVEGSKYPLPPDNLITITVVPASSGKSRRGFGPVRDCSAACLFRWAEADLLDTFAILPSDAFSRCCRTVMSEPSKHFD